MPLMERVFGPGNPVLKLDGLQTQSDRDEQKGFMMLFSGAVAGSEISEHTRLYKTIPSAHLNLLHS